VLEEATEKWRGCVRANKDLKRAKRHDQDPEIMWELLVLVRQ